MGSQGELKDEVGKVAWGHIVRGLVLYERGFSPYLASLGVTLNMLCWEV